MKLRRLVLLFVLTLGLPALAHAQAQQGPTPPGAIPVVLPVERSDAAKLVQHSHTTGATLTLSAGAANSNTQSIYIDEIDISNCEGASAVTAASPTFITTTGINGNPQYMVGSGPATAGTCQTMPPINFVSPLKSATPGTNVTFVLPSFITNQFISVNVAYHLGY